MRVYRHYDISLIISYITKWNIDNFLLYNLLNKILTFQ